MIANAEHAATDRPALRRALPARNVEQVAAAPATQQQQNAWIQALARALDQAANTEEAGSWSGESDRLLRVAHELADHLHIHPDQAGTCGTIDNRAHTVAALIKAALQVPGDTPSAERLAFLEQTRAPLVGLTGCITVLDGWETYPVRMELWRRKAGAVTENKSSQPITATALLPALSLDEHNSFYIRLERAGAILLTLSHVFSGDANTNDPSSVPGLAGTMQYVAGLLRRVYAEGSQMPDELRQRLFEASSLVDVMEHLESNGGYQFNRWADHWMANYLDAALAAVNEARMALEKPGQQSDSTRCH
ncbi:hypothetical protein [Paracidovorax avenae]|uniref:hypothetical protein n=1 Tax=Paracidovorax avenae TaxID=80867 RepID=UPI0006B331BB|nr:hypothetical protein [Paracidovorax avenae]